MNFTRNSFASQAVAAAATATAKATRVDDNKRHEEATRPSSLRVRNELSAKRAKQNPLKERERESAKHNRVEQCEGVQRVTTTAYPVGKRALII